MVRLNIVETGWDTLTKLSDDSRGKHSVGNIGGAATSSTSSVISATDSLAQVLNHASAQAAQVLNHVSKASSSLFTRISKDEMLGIMIGVGFMVVVFAVVVCFLAVLYYRQGDRHEASAEDEDSISENEEKVGKCRSARVSTFAFLGDESLVIGPHRTSEMMDAHSMLSAAGSVKLVQTAGGHMREESKLFRGATQELKDKFKKRQTVLAAEGQPDISALQRGPALSTVESSGEASIDVSASEHISGEASSARTAG